MMNILKINKLLSDKELIGKLQSYETLEEFKKALISYGLELTQEELKLLYEKITNTILAEEQLKGISGGASSPSCGKNADPANIEPEISFPRW